MSNIRTALTTLFCLLLSVLCSQSYASLAMRYPPHARIGVISVLPDKASFSYVSTTSLHNRFFQRPLPTLHHFSETIAIDTAVHLNQFKHYQFQALDMSNNPAFHSGKLYQAYRHHPNVPTGRFTPAVERALHRAAKQRQLDAFVIIDTGTSKPDGSTIVGDWGLFKRSFLGMSATIGYWSYSATVVDAKTLKPTSRYMMSDDDYQKMPASLWQRSKALPNKDVTHYKQWLLEGIEQSLQQKLQKAFYSAVNHSSAV